MLRRNIPIRRLGLSGLVAPFRGAHHSGQPPPHLKKIKPRFESIKPLTNLNDQILRSEFKAWPSTLENVLLDPPTDFLASAPEPQKVDPTPPRARYELGPDSQASAALNELWGGIARNEIEPILAGFKKLRERNALAKLLDADVIKITQLLSDYLSRAPDDQTRQLAQVMAAHFAMRGVPEPLNVAMAFHLRKGDHEAIFELWDETQNWGKSQELLSSKRTWAMAKDDRILYVAAAAAISQEFQRIVNAIRTTTASFDGQRLEDFIHREMFELSPAIRQRFRDYLHDAVLCRDVQQQQMLFSQVEDLILARDSAAMAKLFNSIVDALERKVLVTGAVNVPSVSKQIFIPIHVGGALWSLLVWGAVHCRDIKLAERIMDGMQKYNVKPPINCWNYLMYAHAKQGRIDEIHKILARIQESNTEPDIRTYSIVMSSLFDRRLVRQARQTFDLIKQLPTPHDNEAAAKHPSLLLGAYNLAINGYLRCQLFEEANTVLQEMEAGTGPKPDIVTYNTFLNRYMHMGDRGAVANTLQRIAEAGLDPDLYTFTILFVGASKDRDLEMQTDIIKRMQAMHLQPGVELLSAAVDSIFNGGTREALPAAIAFLERMERNPRDNRRPNLVTYATFLHGIDRLNEAGAITFGEFKYYAEAIYRRIIKRGFTPNRAVHHAMMRMYLKDKEPQALKTALSIFNELKQAQALNTDSWHLLLRGLEMRGERELAKRMVDELKNATSEPLKSSLLRLIERISAR
ncbi:hypothetical protein PIIN_01289 [Serendipita indica DSM 11827]|uniref:Uncharacterized protein n=1 Tax=Serendipita indica (strain DSM 11827) TaxID=1109443 RepID=G4T801_SERID|nr:hypothetical protein PIIN_01289 [Serendipita indica DSM 11827]